MYLAFVVVFGGFPPFLADILAFWGGIRPSSGHPGLFGGYPVFFVVYLAFAVVFGGFPPILADILADWKVSWLPKGHPLLT